MDAVGPSLRVNWRARPRFPYGFDANFRLGCYSQVPGMPMNSPLLTPTLLAVMLAAATAVAGAPAERLRIAVVQMAQTPTLEGTRDRIVNGIADAARAGARVAVFPEAALMGSGSDDLAAVDEAVAAIRRATQQHGVYVMFGATTHTPKLKKNVNWMLVLAPDGRDLLRYDKLYDQPNAPMPRVFEIDGVPCNAMICADRWLRGIEEVPIQQGAQLSFELSCNSSIEWVAPLEWYWYVPRALRNNVWVIFANTGNTVSGVAPYPGGELRHGHSAIIAPDGRLVAASRDDVAALVVADVDVRAATRREALARAAHPALQSFWTTGVKRQAGGTVRAPALTPLTSPAVALTIAAAQVTGDMAAIENRIREAKSRGADLVVFPARAVPTSALPRLQTAARESGIVTVVGAEHTAGSRKWNSAFVLGADGTVLTRYDQLSAEAPFEPGSDPRAMWFRVKGVPAIVLVGRDALWTELAELAAVAGAQVIVHIDHERSSGRGTLRRKQVAASLGSFLTLTATANVEDSMIWDDLRGMEERRAPIGQVLAESGPVEVYSQYSANLVAHARAAAELIVATRRVNAANNFHSRIVARKNPQMDAWFRSGAAAIRPDWAPSRD